jgi:hypothetical protein
MGKEGCLFLFQTMIWSYGVVRQIGAGSWFLSGDGPTARVLVRVVAIIVANCLHKQRSRTRWSDEERAEQKAGQIARRRVTQFGSLLFVLINKWISRSFFFANNRNFRVVDDSTVSRRKGGKQRRRGGQGWNYLLCLLRPDSAPPWKCAGLRPTLLSSSSCSFF